jgi:hypothetical protein
MLLAYILPSQFGLWVSMQIVACRKLWANCKLLLYFSIYYYFVHIYLYCRSLQLHLHLWDTMLEHNNQIFQYRTIAWLSPLFTWFLPSLLPSYLCQCWGIIHISLPCINLSSFICQGTFLLCHVGFFNRNVRNIVGPVGLF